MTYLIHALLIAGGVGLIQYHSIAFWSEHVSSTIGWAWSITIEAGGLWLWYRSGFPSRMLGLLASVLLLAGPLYQISVPALDARMNAQASHVASAQAAQRLRDEIAQDAQLLRTYARNSEARTGWLEPIQSLQKKIEQDRARLDDLETAQAKSVASLGFNAYAVVLLQALGLLLIQLVNVMAITHISGVRRTCAPAAQPVLDVEQVASAVRAVAHDEHTQLRTIAEQVRRLIDAESLSIARAAERLGVDRQNLSFLLNWQVEGDRKPTAASLSRLAEALAC